ncbi:hypothetical protein O3P69_007908 [Scylla paramamosain]|uniref:Uncharacterized protein n=1 Tax=Scylla paramamosain TaxID=85552 RepID=A0AAW0T0X5_SCYPA
MLPLLKVLFGLKLIMIHPGIAHDLGSQPGARAAAAEVDALRLESLSSDPAGPYVLRLSLEDIQSRAAFPWRPEAAGHGSSVSNSSGEWLAMERQ